MKDKLLQLLNESVTPGDFFARGQQAPIDMTLDVKDLGSVRLPIAPGRAKQLIRRCRQAPYGLGQKTLVDTSVRNVWELGPRKFKIHAPRWKDLLKTIVDDTAKQLGLEGQPVKAQLYKLLVYEKGSFFLPHQDTEKTDGMFATLVIALPSQHTGGALIISHNGDSQKILFGGKKSTTSIQYTGFYADCSHEVKPLTSGYRVCLVYNLSLSAKARTGLAPHNQGVEKAAAELLKNWSSKAQAGDKLAVLFDYAYTPAELSLNTLKNNDYTTGQILAQAASEADCEAHLALLSLHEVGEPDASDYDFHDSRRRYYDWDDDDDDEADFDDDGDDGSCYAMMEVFEEELEVKAWFSLAGQRKGLGDIPLSQDEIIAGIDFHDRAADEFNLEGFMGNYGPTLERWYYRAALILWPRRYHYDVVVEAGPETSVPELAAMVKTLTRSKTAQATRLRDCRSLAAAIIGQGGFRACRNNPSLSGMLKLLPALDDPALAKKFIQSVFAESYYGDEGKALAGFLDRLGWDVFKADLIALSDAEENVATYKITQLLAGLYQHGKEARRLPVLKTLANRIAARIETWDNNKYGRGFRYDPDFESNGQKAVKVIIALLVQSPVLFDQKTVNRLVRYFISTEAHYPLHEVLMPVVATTLAKARRRESLANPAVRLLIREIFALLARRTAEPVRIPDHWRIDAEWSCQCDDCAELRDFLHDPGQRTLEVKMGKERRKHMHRTIDGGIPDVSHTTIRQGSPFTLVYKKNRQSYAEKEKKWQREKQFLEQYQPLLN